VVNLRTLPEGWAQNPDYVYIGRPGKGLFGPWGNPIAHGRPCRVCMRVHESPGSTLPCYRSFLHSVLESPQGDQFKANVRGLSGRTLACFCAPKPCHGHDLVRIWRQLAQADASLTTGDSSDDSSDDA
jgi:hypothetical protein